MHGGVLAPITRDTIRDTQRWLSVLRDVEPDDDRLRIAAHYLATDVDYLDFDRENASQMKFHLTKEDIARCRHSPHYATLQHFEYIGVKYYTE